MNICAIFGDFGPLWSLPFLCFADRLAGMGYTVTKWAPDHPQPIVEHIARLKANEKLALIGYSWGGNCVSWVAAAVPHRPISLAVSYDATRNSFLTPLGGNVHRAISYVSISNIGASAFFGKARFTANQMGPEIEVHDVDEDHLGVQGDENLHKITIAALKVATARGI